MSVVLSNFFASLLALQLIRAPDLDHSDPDSLPALALGTEASEQNLMQRPPR
jgi:hypothetical protein